MTDERPRVIYLLHFPNKVGRCHHYLGITRKERLRIRLRQHLGGFGARLTARAGFDNPTMILVALWPHADFALERTLKRRGNYKMYCQLCRDVRAMRQPRIRHLNISMSRPKYIEHQDRRPAPLSF